MSTEDRRAPGASRIPFDGLVEVGGAMGPAFEAQAVNLSEEGMLLRTAYLPEAGQPLTCRFDAGPGETVLASGEVVWAQGAEKGGEFAIRFTEMDHESVDALKRACGVAPPTAAAPGQPGQKVRLHIDGLASPMRAKIRDAKTTAITVGSDLGFLQVGKQLELEDATTGGKRPASIDRVEVAVNPESHVPQLVVTLRYADVVGEASEPQSAKAPAQEPAKAVSSAADAIDVTVEEESMKMKGTVARNIARIGPAMERLAKQAKVTLALLAAKRGGRDEPGAQIRRTTAPAPGGGLHAAGRRVVRGESGAASEEEAPKPKYGITRKKAMIAGGVMATAVLGAVILKKTHHETPPEPVAAATTQSGATPPPTAVAESTPPPAATTTPAATTPIPSPFDNGGSFVGGGGAGGAMANAGDEPGGSGSEKGKHHGKVSPFGNGPVHHGNVLRLKMDGPIDAIEGAQQPTGFAVKIPGRRSLEAAGPLASRDSRIAAIKVSNDPQGAELTLSFKDGVPNYQVSAHGDALVISLAPAGALAKADAKGGHAKHGKHEHKHGEKR